MNLFVILLSFILFNGNYIYGSDADETNGIDVLGTLKTQAPNCDLHKFVNPEDEFKALNDDLTKYCSTSDSSKQYKILCRMILIELTQACALSSKSRSVSTKYSSKTSASAICQYKNIQMTNKWIWKKLTSDEQKQIGDSSKDICTKITKYTDTIQLARFFYKIGTGVRKAELSVQNKGLLKRNASH
jgi:hypothetical protein